MTWEHNGDTVFAGALVDQAALHGLLKKVRDSGLPLVSDNQIQSNKTNAYYSQRGEETMTINASLQPMQESTLICHSSNKNEGGPHLYSPESKKIRRAAYPILLLIMLPLLIGSVIACKSSPSSTVDESTVRAYADPATDTTLQGLSENGLAKYTQYGNVQFKAAVTREILDKVAAQITNQFGTYVSKEYLRFEELQGYIVVHYKAKWTKGDVGIKMAFDKDHLVAGQFFE